MGAVAAGATGILVNDAHGPMTNLLPDLLDPRATLIKGRPKPMGMMEGLTSEYDAVLWFESPGGTPTRPERLSFRTAPIGPMSPGDAFTSPPSLPRGAARSA